MNKNLIKVSIIICLIFAGLSCFLSCSKKAEQTETVVEETHTDEEQADWKEMDDFHLIMAETFHPYKDSSNLEPLKTSSADLLAAANKWFDSPIPEKVNNDEVKEKLTLLKTEATKLDSIVKAQADDAVIAASLTELHNTFHSIQEHWYEHKDSDHEHH